MATSGYLLGRQKYSRPQAILWSENSGTLVDGLYVPTGQEIGATSTLTTGGTNQFLLLSDHNRSEISFTPERIEKRQRTINGRMRSYHIADKMRISWSWTNLPSRAYYQYADFDSDGESPYKGINGQEYTVDGGAGGVELLRWYETHPGPFWMFLAYDNYRNFGNNNEAFGHLGQYNEVVQVYFADFNYTVTKRGQLTHDFWNISVSLEEV